MSEIFLLQNLNFVSSDTFAKIRESSALFVDGIKAFLPCPSIVRSLSGKNWQDRDKTDKVSISFLFEKFIIPGVG